MRFRSPDEKTLYVASTNGECCRIGPKWREIPQSLHADAIAAGAITDNMDAATAEAQAQKANPPPPTPNGDNPETLVREGIVKLLESDDEGALTQAGKPNLKKLSSIVGFDVDRAVADKVWAELQAETAGGGDNTDGDPPQP